MLRQKLGARHPEIDAGYFLRPFMLCCIPVRRPKHNSEKWSRRYGPAEFYVTPESKQAFPAGQDRLILLLAARAAILQKRREVTLGTASAILKTLGFPADGRNYDRLEHRFRRVLGSAMTCVYWQKAGGVAKVIRSSQISFEKAHLWFERKSGMTEKARFENSLTVSDGFWDEIQRNPAFVDMAVVRGLAHTSGSLAFYFWLSLCAHTTWPDHVREIPLQGPLGLKTRLGISGYTQQRDFARMARRWLENVKSVWEDCPASLSHNGSSMNVWDLPRNPLTSAF